MMNDKNSIYKIVLLLALVGLLIVIPIEIYSRNFASEQPAQGGTFQGNGYPGPGMEALKAGLPTPTPLLAEVQQILEYEEILKRDNLSDEDRKRLENKIEILSRVATERAIAKEVTAVYQFPTPDARPIATRPTGLREGGSSDFHAWEAVIQNRWSQYGNNNEHITVYAGELGSEMEYPGRGVIFVLRLPSAAISGASFNRYLLPEGTGWVRISEVKGDILILTSKEEETFYFNISAQQFVSALTDAPPTVTPLPTPLPLATIGPPTTPASPYP